MSHQSQKSGRRPIHHYWITWVFIGLMLLAMALYIVNMGGTGGP